MAVEYWHQFFMPLHFTDAAKKRYGYQPRSGSGEPPVLRRPAGSKGFYRTYNNPKYYWRKMREKGHSIPLVYTGRSEQAARQVRITASARQGVGVLFALPKYFYQFRKDHKAPDKVAELLVVLDSEAAEMGRAPRKPPVAPIRHSGICLIRYSSVRHSSLEKAPLTPALSPGYRGEGVGCWSAVSGA